MWLEFIWKGVIKEEGRRKKEEGRRKKEEAIKARVSAIQNLCKISICRAAGTPHLTRLVRSSFMRTLVLTTNRDSLSEMRSPRSHFRIVRSVVRSVVRSAIL
ncbi:MULTISPECIES: hypothetical protein [unclassified Microcoleus]|uniref:hypothetical protein n=1 Tax=unclassified Microcoleus TaxID=2642155 RepID=UPI002FCF0470